MALSDRPAEWAKQLRAGEVVAWKLLHALVDRCLERPAVPLSARDREEVACDALEAVWRSLEGLRENQKLLAIVKTVTRRLTYIKARESRRFLPLYAEPSAVDPACTGKFEAEELYRALLRPLKGTDELLFQLLYIAGANAGSIRAALGLSGPELRKRKHILHKKLRSAVMGYRRDEAALVPLRSGRPGGSGSSGSSGGAARP